MAPEIDNVARVGGLPENAGPQGTGAARGLVPERFKVSECGRDVGTARTPTLGGLMLGEHGLDDGADNVHESCAEDPAQGDGELEGALTRRGVRPFLLWNPNAEVFVRAESIDA